VGERRHGDRRGTSVAYLSTDTGLHWKPRPARRPE
jgi:hypothetical protein